MGRPDTESQRQRFLEALREFEGTAGNTKLMRFLGMTEQEYWRVRQALLDDGRSAVAVAVAAFRSSSWSRWRSHGLPRHCQSKLSLASWISTSRA